MPEYPVANPKPSHVGADLADDTDRHVAQRLRKRLPTFAGIPGHDRTERIVVRAIRHRVISVADQFGTVLRGGELGFDPNLVRAEGGLRIFPERGCSWSDGD